MSPSKESRGRRQEPRMAGGFPLRLFLQDPATGKDGIVEGTVVNFSAHGLVFRLASPLPLLSVVDLELVPPAGCTPCRAKGWLVWENETAGLYGVQFPEVCLNVEQLIAQLKGTRSEVAPEPDRRRSSAAPVTDRRSGQTKGFKRGEFTMFDRRSALRLQTKRPIRLQTEGGRHIEATLDGISEFGVCFRSAAAIREDVPVLIELPIADDQVLGVPVQVAWFVPADKGQIRYGGRFGDLKKPQQDAIKAFLVKALTEPKAVSDRRLRSNITSELFTFRNRKGLRVVGYHDHRTGSGYRRDPLIIIPSAYSETKKDALQTAYYLVANGFQVLRYDNTNHTGESEGEILNITLNNFKEDLLSAIDYAERGLGINRVGVVAASLSARTSIKAAAEDPRVVFILGLVAAVDVRYTLHAVYCEDLVGTYQGGKLWGITNVLGCNTQLDDFLKDAIDHRYHDLATTCADVARLKAPLVLLAAEHDPWVRFDDVKRVLADCGAPAKELHLIPAMHQLKENPRAAQAAFRVIVSRAMHFMMGQECRPLSVKEPSLRSLAVQNRIERQRMRLLSAHERSANQSFWTQYLHQFHFINELPDYRQLLHSLFEGVHGFHPREKVLDAGCGNGTFGLWLLTMIAFQAKNDPKALQTTLENPIDFHCLDYVEDALTAARQYHRQLRDQLFPTAAPMQFSYHTHDLENPLPFSAGTFDKVVSNLVISYLSDPTAMVRELLRVVKPGGKIVISTLKPFADTSQIYRNYVQVQPGQERVEQTRKLLNNAGDIKLKEAEGHFSFFSEEELLGIAREAGAKETRVVRSFGDQANVLIIQA